jgi:hypothetical protein
VDMTFLLTECTPFLPHVNVGVIPDEVLDEFCCDRGATSLSAPRLMQQFGMLSLEDKVPNLLSIDSIYFKLEIGMCLL